MVILILFILLVLSIILWPRPAKEAFQQNDKITFIIPTIGRDTLMNSIQSLMNQTNSNWNAIIVFDGIEPTIKIDDPRIKIISISKKGKDVNSAGLVRNEGIKIANTKWIAFLDDDDYLSENYVDIFYKELNINPDLDVLIHRMVSNNDLILPELNDDNFYINKVGISFCYKKELFDAGMIFVPSRVEDYILLDKMRNNKCKIVISPYISYFVKNYKYNNTLPSGARVKINY